LQKQNEEHAGLRASLKQSKSAVERLEDDVERLQKDLKSSSAANAAIETFKKSLEESERINGSLHESLRRLEHEVFLKWRVRVFLPRCLYNIASGPLTWFLAANRIVDQGHYLCIW